LTMQHEAVHSPRKTRLLEFFNKHDTCPEQTLRWLRDAAKSYGDNLSRTDAEKYRGGLPSLCIKRFGSFNKAKQIAKLVVNNIGVNRYHINEYPKLLVLEDMCIFYKKYSRWPNYYDYKEKKLNCSQGPIRRMGGLSKLQKEAAELLEKQKNNTEFATKEIPRIAASIELQYAGTARR